MVAVEFIQPALLGWFALSPRPAGSVCLPVGDVGEGIFDWAL